MGKPIELFSNRILFLLCTVVIVVLAAGIGVPASAVPPPSPTVTGLAPTQGPVSGGTTVTITGTNFTDATKVLFNGIANTTPFTVNSDSSITATSPPSTTGSLVGAVTVQVTTPFGTSTNSLYDLYTYTADPAPAVTGLAPNQGPVSGGTTVTITGTSFTDATKVLFNGVAVTTPFTVNSDSSITATSPPSTTGSLVGAVTVQVTTPFGTSTNSMNNLYTYTADPAPTVTGLAPNQGPVSGGTTVTITGTSFTDATKVLFNGIANTTPFTVNSDSSITATSPPSTTGSLVGAVTVQVTTPFGTSTNSLYDLYTYTADPAPTVTGLAPTQGPVSGGTTVTITGTSFTDATKVLFNGIANTTPFTVNSDSSITATSPSSTLGTFIGPVAVQVTTPFGTSANSLADQFTYVGTPITGIGAITGTPQVGQILTNGTVTPASANVTFQWNESVSINGPYAPIAGATSETYTPVAGDIGYYLEVNVTGAGSYTGFATSPPAGPVTAAPTSRTHSTGTCYWCGAGTGESSSGYTGPASTPVPADPTSAPVMQPTVSNPVTVAATPSPAYTQPLPINTPKSGIDATPIIGALGLCGAIFLFRKNGN
jgi:hypothetical protein